MKHETISDATDKITAEAVTNSATRMIPAGAVLVVTRSGILEHSLPAAITTVPVAINQDLKALLPRSGVLSEFVLLALKGLAQDILRDCSKTGTTVANISMDRLLDFPLLLPPFAEQRRIVAQMDALFMRIKLARKDLERSEQLALRFNERSVTRAFSGDLTADWRRGDAAETNSLPFDLSNRDLVDALQNSASTGYRPAIELPSTWKWATVDELAHLVQYGSSARTLSQGPGVPVLRMGNIVGGRLELTHLKFLPRSHDEFPHLFLEPGDILFNRTNSAALVGKAAVYEGTPAPCSFASYLIRIRTDDILPELLSAYINSSFGREWVAAVVSQQVGQANVNGTKLRSLQIPLPPRDEQQLIASRLRMRIGTTAAVHVSIDRANVLLNQLERTILSNALHGELAMSDVLGK